MRDDPIRDFMIFSVAVGAVAFASNTYAAQPSNHTFYFNTGLGKSFDQGTRTVVHDNTYIIRKAADQWAQKVAIGYAYQLNSADRLGLTLGYGQYGIRHYRELVDTVNNLETIYDIPYEGWDALMVGSHDSGEFRLQVKAGIQRTKAGLQMRDNTRTGSGQSVILTRARYDWQPKVGVGYEYIVKENAALSVNYSHTWGRTLDHLKEIKGIHGGAESTYNAPNRVPSLNTVLFGITLYV